MVRTKARVLHSHLCEGAGGIQRKDLYVTGCTQLFKVSIFNFSTLSSSTEWSATKHLNKRCLH